MLLRKLTVAFAPLLLCIVVCTAFRWVDGLWGSGSFLAFAAKGVLLGAALALVLPAAGVRVHTNGLTGWLFVGAAVLLGALVYQFMETTGRVHVPMLQSVMAFNGQVVLVEAAAMGYMTMTGLLYRRR